MRACTEGAASASASLPASSASASFTAFSGGGHSLKSAAVAPGPALAFDANDDPELAAAIAASLVTSAAPLSADAMRQARLARFG